MFIKQLILYWNKNLIRISKIEFLSIVCINSIVFIWDYNIDDVDDEMQEGYRISRLAPTTRTTMKVMKMLFKLRMVDYFFVLYENISLI